MIFFRQAADLRSAWRRRQAILRCCRVVVCVCLAAGMGGGTADAEPPDNPLQFQRVIVPGAMVLKLATDHRAMRRTEFEAVVQAIRDLGAGAPPARVARATYRARLIQEQVLDGSGVWHVALDGSAPQGVRLDPCNLALTAVQWESDQRPGELVSTAQSASLLVIDRGGKLAFAWSRTGAFKSQGTTTFALELPLCPRNELVLELPFDREPMVSEGYVVREGTREGWQIWRVLLGSRTRFTLTVTAPEEIRPSQPRQPWSLQNRTTCTPQGIETVSQLRLASREPVVELRMPNQFSVRSVRSGDTELAWSVRQSGSEGQSVFIERGQAASLDWEQIRVEASASLTNQVTRLPLITLNNGYWLSTQNEVRIDPALHLEHIDTEDCQVERAEFSGDDGYHVLQIVALSEEHAADLSWGTSRGLYESSVLHKVSLDSAATQATCFVKTHVDGLVSLRDLRFDLGVDWSVVSVDLLGDNAIADWFARASGDGVNQLQVFLVDPVLPGDSLRLRVNCRRRAVERGKRISLNALRPLRVTAPEWAREYMALGTPSGTALRMRSDASVAWIEPVALEADWTDFGGLPAAFRCFELTSQQTHASLVIDPEIPRYRAEIDVRLEGSAESLSQVVRIRCIPDGSIVSQVPIRFAEPDQAPKTWYLETSDGELPLRVRGAGGGRGRNRRRSRQTEEGTNVVNLPESLDVPFTIVARKMVAVDKEAPLALPMLPDAVGQRGTLSFGMPPGFEIVGLEHLTRLPAENAAADADYALLECYEFEPGNLVAQAQRPIVRRAAKPQLMPEAWIWQVRHESRLNQDGRIDHWATYYIENPAGATMQLSMPASARIQSVSLNGSPLQADSGIESQASLQVSLPRGRRFVVVAVNYVLPGNPLGWFRQLVMPRSQTNLQVLDAISTFVVPPQYQLSVPALPATQVSWQRRLLGPFCRQEGSPVDNPHAFWELPRDVRVPRDVFAWNFVETLDQVLRTREPDAFTWQELLSAMETPFPGLRLDAAALRRQGVRPASQVRPPAEDAPGVQAGLSLLKEYGLAVVTQGQRDLLLTDASAAGILSGGNARDRGGRIYLAGVNIRPWSSTPDQVVGEALSVSEWARMSWPFMEDATVSPSLRLADAQGSDWSVLQLRNSPESEQVFVYRPAAIASLGWITFVLAFGLQWWSHRDQFWRGRKGWVAFVLAAFALWMPHPWAPISTGAWLGWCVGWILTASVSLQPPTLARVIVLWLISWLGNGAAVEAQQPGSSETTAAGNLVIVPSAPVAEEPFLYVPHEVYAGLMRRVQEAQQLPREWAIHQARYLLTVDRDETEWHVSEIQAELLVEYPFGNRTLPLPFRGQDVILNRGDALLDYRPVAVAWSADAETLRVPSDRAGQQILHLRLTPRQPALIRNGFRLDVPSVSNSEVRIRVVDESMQVGQPPIRVDSAWGGTEWIPEDRELRVQLGAAKEIRLTQSLLEGAVVLPQGESQFDSKMTLLPGAALLECDLSWESSAPFQELTLVLDTRCSVMAFDEESALVTRRRDEPREVAVRFQRPQPLKGSFRLLIACPANTATAIVRLPSLQVRGWTTTARRLTVQPGQVPVEPITESVTSTNAVAVKDSESVDFRPEFDLPEEETRWLAAWPDTQGPVSGDCLTTYLVAARELRVVTVCDLAAPSGSARFYQMDVPRSLYVRKLQLFSGTLPIDIRWAQSRETGSVLIWSDEPWAEEQRIVCEAFRELPASGEIRLPRIEIEEVVWNERLAQLMVAQDLAVTMNPEAHSGAVRGIRADASVMQLSAAGNRYRPWSIWSDSEDDARNLRFAPNDAVLLGGSLTRMDHQDGTWHAIVDGWVDVQRGRLDAVRIEVPATWRDRLRVESPADMPYEFVPAAHSDRVVLMLHPRESVVGQFRFRLAAELPAQDEPDFQVPHVGLKDVPSPDRYILVPRSVGGRPWDWVYTNVQVARKLPEIMGNVPLTQDVLAFRVSGPAFRVVGTNRAHLQGEPTVHLADIRVRWLKPAQYRAVVDFDLSVESLRNCRIILPAESSPERLLLDGHGTGSLTRRDDGWQVRLGPSEMPRRLSVFYRGYTHGESVRLQLPEIHNETGQPLPAQKKLWTIQDTTSDAIELVHPELVTSIDAATLQFARLSNASQLMEAVYDRYGATMDVRRWIEPWLARWNGLTVALQTQAHMSRDLPVQSAQGTHPAVEAFRDIDASTVTPDALEFACLTAQGGPVAQAGQWLFVETGPGRDSVSVRRRERASWSTEWFAKTLVLGFILIALRVWRAFPLRQQAFRRFSAPLGIAAGTVWVLWLAPQWLGWVILSLSVLASLRQIETAVQARIRRRRRPGAWT